MSSGGGSSGGGMGTQESTSTSTSTPTLYNWKEILPPWVQSGQQKALPWLLARAQTGMLPQEERQLWGQARGSIEDSSNIASRNFSRQLASSGLSPSSPMVGGAYADLASDRSAGVSKAALDFAKLKMGARDTALGQLLTALYTPPPAAVGQTTTSTQRSMGITQQGGGGGGGK
jgi:hypothetical protein